MDKKDLELLRQYLTTYLPPEAHITMAKLFDELLENPLKFLSSGMIYTHCSVFKDPNQEVGTAAANGILLGVALAICMKYPIVKKLLTDSIEMGAKANGENVVNFIDETRKR
jgi:hypothetical protein